MKKLSFVSIIFCFLTTHAVWSGEEPAEYSVAVGQRHRVLPQHVFQERAQGRSQGHPKAEPMKLEEITSNGVLPEAASLPSCIPSNPLLFDTSVYALPLRTPPQVIKPLHLVRFYRKDPPPLLRALPSQDVQEDSDPLEGLRSPRPPKDPKAVPLFSPRAGGPSVLVSPRNASEVLPLDSRPIKKGECLCAVC